MGVFRAGAARAEITPPAGGLMDGYGARQAPSEAVHDQLFARVLVLDDGSSRAAVVGCDLLGMHPFITEEVRSRACAESGITPGATMVAATHNHAGPAGLRAGMFARLDEALARQTVLRITRAIEQATSALAPVSVVVGAAPVDTLPMNRRDPAGPSDSALRLVLFLSDQGPVACLLNFACHATVLNAANLQLSAEFPGVACRVVEQATGAMPIYLNGACGDVNPAWMRQDFPSVERAGQAIGGTAVRLIADMRAVVPGLRAHNIRWDEFLPLASPGRVAEARLSYERREVEIPFRHFESDEVYAVRIDEARAQAERHAVGTAQRRAAEAALSRWNAERWAAAWSRRSNEGEYRATEVQAVGLGDGLAILALPGEFFAETGSLIRREAGVEDVLIACYANDYVGYVVPAGESEAGGYESGITFFQPQEEEAIRQTAVDMLRRLR